MTAGTLAGQADAYTECKEPLFFDHPLRCCTSQAQVLSSI